VYGPNARINIILMLINYWLKYRVVRNNRNRLILRCFRRMMKMRMMRKRKSKSKNTTFQGQLQVWVC